MGGRGGSGSRNTHFKTLMATSLDLLLIIKAKKPLFVWSISQLNRWAMNTRYYKWALKYGEPEAVKSKQRSFVTAISIKPDFYRGVE